MSPFSDHLVVSTSAAAQFIKYNQTLAKDTEFTKYPQCSEGIGPGGLPPNIRDLGDHGPSKYVDPKSDCRTVGPPFGLRLSRYLSPHRKYHESTHR